MEFRRAVPGDAESILSLWNAADAVHGVTDTIEDVRRMAGNANAAFILAVCDGRIAGSIIAAFDGWRGSIYRLAVHPDFRRKSLARALLAEAEKMFAEWGVKRITAIVVKEHPWAMGFWNAAGYTIDERVARFVRNPFD
jgi:ribosomal protein S18 acetylase RimI-like enzyme